MATKHHLYFVVIPDAAELRCDCVSRIANANAKGGSQSEHQGWRESTQRLSMQIKTTGFRVQPSGLPRNDEWMDSPWN
jgi:hypothetical protein